jgi:hypothetical protein
MASGGGGKSPGAFSGMPEPPMEIHQIRYFLATAEDLNFTRAA